ncbi:MAG: Na+/H+ antiporter NhaA [Flavobacteriales bacterium]|nr:Na+/H+ antiporter NhaA [Flavobacteriales bacterium]
MRQDPIDRLLKPLDLFIRNQTMAGLALFISAAVAVVLANSPWRDAYHQFWEHSITVGIDTFIFERNLHHLINDGLMAVFFFVVALELKREFLAGELSDPRNAVLPLAASVGGMVFPALIYLAINNFEGPATRGWGITMGTDTAFVLGLLALLGKRVPAAIKALFITVAVTDDIASVTVIALFYTSDISLMNLGIGAAFLAVLVAMNLLGVRNMTAYGVIGIGGLWTAFMLSGVHATVAGVLAALTIPVNTKMKERSYAKKIRELADAFDRTKDTAALTITREQEYIISKVKRFSTAAETPLQRLEQALHPWVAFLVLPVFALANAGIELPDSIFGVFDSPVTMGVMLGLVLGKPIGLLLMSWTFVKLGWGKLGTDVNWGHMVAISVLSGLGFTMAIFISELAFASEAMRAEAKLGILFASITAGVIGTWLFTRCKPVHSIS